MELLELRWGKKVFSEHLVDGVTHIATEVAEIAVEIEAGARTFDTISPKMHDAVRLWMDERQADREYVTEKRNKQSQSAHRR